MNTPRTLAAVIFLGLAACQTAAPRGFPGYTGVPHVEALQATADEAFAAGDYDTAYRVYSEELVPLADKYAQYAVGVMHLEGLGRTPDRAEGTAWFILAAERDDRRLASARDAALATLDDSQRTVARARAAELTAELGDCARVLAWNREDRRLLAHRTGSRVGTARDGRVHFIEFLERPSEELQRQREAEGRMRLREAWYGENCS